ncbi:hypothetical protein NQ318_007301 [Aromia moschata]|uniref:Calpain catalytic domain-containing protein n=1 Tax=Aromia moschata TaxID=1265417 RepID=A0AAV8Z227_9CUCU|nr:hypothetical protein NQ318_007301 [Aromia moschata]
MAVISDRTSAEVRLNAGRLADLTGGITESIPIRQDPASSARLLQKLLDMTSIITCTVQPPNQVRSHTEKLANGVQIGINYRIYSIERVETFNGETIQLIKIRNPLGAEFRVRRGLVHRCAGVVRHSPQELDRVQGKLLEGEFWISYTDFVNTFTHLEVVHLDNDTSRDEPTLHHKNTWQMRLYQGNWQKGVSSGGCRNNPDTFHINPQLHLLLSEMEEVVVSLNQHSIMEPKVIGFTSYSLPKSSTETIGKAFFKKNKSLFNSQYTNSRQVSHRCQLEQGGYLIIPTTFEPGQESGFTLRVYSSKPLKLKLLDTAPLLVKSAIVKAPPLLDGKSFSQYEAVFLQLADEHRTVNAFELQELLDACLPNDYIKSCASIEVCRQIVLTFESLEEDNTYSARLKNKTRTEQDVCNLFNAKCPDNTITQSTVSKIESKFRETGNVKDLPKSGRPKITQDKKIDIVLSMEENPQSTSTLVASENEVSQTAVLRILRKENYHPYKFQLT